MNIKRFINFTNRYFFKHPLYVFVYGCVYLMPNFKVGANFYSISDTLKLLRDGKSLIRLGDGEANILLDLANVYQDFDPRVKLMISKIISEYKEDSPYVLSVPKFINISNTELREMGKLNVWLPFKILFLLSFQKNVPYMDAHSFYYDRFFEKDIYPLFEKKTVVLITREETVSRQLMNPNLPWKDIRYVKTPAEGAFDKLANIRQDIDQIIETLDVEKTVLFFALGPVGKYLILEYAQKGYQGIDIGKVAEVMFTKESIAHLV